MAHITLLASHIVVATVALIFLVGAWQKLRDRMGFEIALENYELLPAQFSTAFALLLPVLEIAAAACLLWPATQLFGLLLAVTILTMVTLAVAVNLLRGRRDVGCGCGGIEDEQLLSWALVVRNVLIGAALIAAVPLAPVLPVLWLDYVTLSAATVSGYGLYVLINQLIANQPRLLTLRATP